MTNADTPTFLSYGRCARSTSPYGVRPKSIDEVQQIFSQAAREKRHVTMRGGGHSFDGQAIPGDDSIALMTDCFNDIKIDKANLKMTVGAGATWGRILQECLAEGVIPWIIQTGSKATAGGTLAGDVLSRFSRRESVSIESFYFVPVNGKAVHCNRAEPPGLFNAVIGGLGYLGFVTDITYRLLPIEKDYCVYTEVEAYDNLPSLINAQSSHSRNSAIAEDKAKLLSGDPGMRMMSSNLTTCATEALLAVSSAEFMSLTDPSKIKGAVFKSSYAKRQPGIPLPEFPLYANLDSPGRIATELGARDDFFDSCFHEAAYVYVQAFRKFENKIPDFTFFMDGNANAKAYFEKNNHGKYMPIIQQTWVIPAGRILDFANVCVSKLIETKLHPTEFDILFVNADDCLMSANRGQAGFALSIAFENFDPADQCPPSKIEKFLREMSRISIDFSGRIHLVKNVYADPDVFEHMFSGGLEPFLDFKYQFDPDFILRNPFFDRLFIGRRGNS